jgi:cytochrome c peroxidase
MLSMRRLRIVAGALALPAFLILGLAAEKAPKVPLGLPPLMWPRQNPYSADKVELGRYLYFDRRLSADETISCASCHDPQKAFTDGAAVSTGIRAQKGNRSAPTIINRAYSLAQFWDGRATSLEDQAKGPMANPGEMGNTHEAIVGRLKGIAGYRTLFAKAYGTEEITIDRAAMAIASFERTVLSGNAPYDRYKNGDKKAMTPEQVRGMSVFTDKAKCDKCHEGSNFTLNAYSNLGVGSDKPDPDLGRFTVTHDPRDWGVFKTPTLREVEHTAPYMHDGSLKTLDDVVEFYNKGGIKNKNLDPNIKPLNLTDQEKKEVVAFMKSLSGQGWQNVKAPEELPK